MGNIEKPRTSTIHQETDGIRWISRLCLHQACPKQERNGFFVATLVKVTVAVLVGIRQYAANDASADALMIQLVRVTLRQVSISLRLSLSVSWANAVYRN